MLDIKHSIPPRIDVTSRWGRAGLSVVELEFVAHAVANKLPPFTLQEMRDTAEAAVSGIDADVIVEVIQVACTAQQAAARHINANMGSRGVFASAAGRSESQ